MATKYGAYAGKVMYVDLTTKTYKEYPVNDNDRKLFIGGKVLAARIIHDFVKGPMDPFSPENPIVITTCPLNGTPCPSSARFNVSTISPLTNLLTSSNCGGSFGAQLKKAGLDALIIVGKSEDFIYLDVSEDGIEFKDAEFLRGLTTGAAQELLPKKAGKFVIGPAGENLVKYACVVSDERAAGRGGVGAVFGSKNLKGVIADGKSMAPRYDQDKLTKLVRKWTKDITAHPLTGSQLPKLGTAGLLSTMQQKNLLATKNFKEGQYEGFRDICGEELAEKYLIKNKGCRSCPIQCGRVVEVNGKQVKGPEVEIMGLMGANILNNDLQKIIQWNYELDELGMDTISASGTIAFAMELNEKGIWDSGLEFGKIDNISQVIDDIAYRCGEVADQLANGSRWLSEKYGGKDFCMNAKGMELSAYQPRAAVGQGLGYAVSNRGGCHLNGGYLVVLEGLGLSIDQYTPFGKAALTVMFQDVMESVSAGGNCLFTTYAFFPPFLLNKPNWWLTRLVNKVFPYLGPVIGVANKHSKALKVNISSMLPQPLGITHATGIKMTMGSMMALGARGYNLERLINLRLGLDPKTDTLPKRLSKVLQDPDNKKSKVPIEKMVKQYYKARGWNKDGTIKKRTLKYFNILDLDDISKRPLEEQGERNIIPPKPKKDKKPKAAKKDAPDKAKSANADAKPTNAAPKKPLTEEEKQKRIEEALARKKAKEQANADAPKKPLTEEEKQKRIEEALARKKSKRTSKC